MVNIYIIGTKKGVLDKGDGMNKCTLSILCSLFASQEPYQKNQSVFFSSHKEWSQNRVTAMQLATLGHFLFRRNLESVDAELLGFRSRLKKSTLLSLLCWPTHLEP